MRSLLWVGGMASRLIWPMVSTAANHALESVCSVTIQRVCRLCHVIRGVGIHAPLKDQAQHVMQAANHSVENGPPLPGHPDSAAARRSLPAGHNAARVSPRGRRIPTLPQWAIDTRSLAWRSSKVSSSQKATASAQGKHATGMSSPRCIGFSSGLGTPPTRTYCWFVNGCCPIQQARISVTRRRRSCSSASGSASFMAPSSTSPAGTPRRLRPWAFVHG